MTGRLVKQALAVYVFFPAAGPRREQAYAALKKLWTACGERLGMDAAIAPLGLPAELPAAPGPDTSGRALAARQHPGEAIRQAFVVRTHDIFALVVMLAPQPPASSSWQQLDQSWSALAGDVPPAAVLGETRLYLALLHGHEPPDNGHVLARSAHDVRGALPAAADAPDQWWDRGLTTPQGFGLWEASSAQDARSQRRIAVVAAEESETELDDWVWTGGNALLPPFARYLLHMAKIRYELRVYAGGGAVRELRDRADAQVDGLFGLLATDQEAGRVPPSDASLVAASARLLSVRADSAGLIQVAIQLREMRRTVQIATANMAAVLETGAAVAGPLADDRALADWFAQQLDDDSLYLEAARERTRDVADVAATVVQHRLQQRQEEVSRRQEEISRAQERASLRQERFNLLQTAVIGAVVLGLTAVQALGYQLPLPGPLKPPVIAALGALALLLATIVVRLALGSGSRPLAWPSYLAAGLTGAAVAWMAVAGVSGDGLHQLAAPLTTGLLSLAGFAVGLVAYAVATRRLRAAARP